jgi:peroxiredoxin-like protein
MKPLPHHYAVSLSGGFDGYAALSGVGLDDLSTAPPPEFGGPGDAWSPEHMLLGAVETCFLFTLRALARARRLDFESLEASCEGTVERQDGVTRFTEIVLRPRLVLRAGANREEAMRLMEKAERACLVSASLRTAVRLEPEVTTG